ncbi:hypothetical protein FB45DRAFT_1086760 [Roridomyces roridus]|uniref:F-box domain-containing protein n=1 Tax=Roridomyces roridus TaxID=1738132 RepID=A0AAD7BLR6_9AGAR|nr:hypothetical protein FB45DRAFT_1086760 [Roridomyces roridus]
MSTESAISKLPSKLLSEILEAACPDPAADPIRIHAYGSNIQSIVSFSQVCRHWRLLAHAPVHAHLWKYSSTWFDPEWFPEEYFERLRIKLLLYFSYAPPLISFCVDVGSGPCDGERLRWLLEPHAHRLETLDLRMESPFSLAAFLDTPPLPFDRLQTLDIILESPPEETRWYRNPERVSGVFAQAPQLTDVSISVDADLANASSVGWAPDPFFVASLPLSVSLTSVTMTNLWLSPSDAKELFTRCSQDIGSDGKRKLRHEEDDILPPGPISLPNLRQLDITCCRLGLDADLTAPQLEDLALTGCFDEEIPWDVILELQKRSNFDLKVLCLRSETASQVDEILTLLMAAPNLHTLELSFASQGTMNCLVQSMERLDNSETEILPNLRVLHVNFVDGAWGMLKSRASQLSSVTLYLNEREYCLGDFMREFEEEITYLRLKGVNVELTAMELEEDGEVISDLDSRRDTSETTEIEENSSFSS